MRNKKRIIGIALLLLLVFAAIITANIIKKNTNITSLSVAIHSEHGAFITEGEIRNILFRKFGDLKRHKIKEITAGEVETLLMGNPYVSKASFYVNMTGKATVTVIQREPVVQIVDLDGETSWLDSNGYRMPLSPHYTPNVPIANGKIANERKRNSFQKIDTAGMMQRKTNDALLAKILYLVKTLRADSLLRFQIDQIYVNSQTDFQLIPKIGDAVIELGDVDQLSEKLYKLKHLYSEGFRNGGWDRYTKINLEFKDQVVGTRK